MCSLRINFGNSLKIPPRKIIEKPVEKAPPKAKMTRKRMMRAKHEKRLREEQIALEESKKEQIYERKKQRKEKLKKELDRRPNDGVLQLETEDFDWKPRRKRRKELEKEREAEEAAEKRKKEKEQLPSLKFKFGKDVVDMIQKKELPLPPHKAPATDENANKLEAIPPSATKPGKLTENGKYRDNKGRLQPLLKMNIQFKRVDGGMLIHCVRTTKHNLVRGLWQSTVSKCISKSGVFSKTEFPRKPEKFKLPPPSPIPKLRLRRNPDNTYSKI
ncbi:Coiled-coil domain-containing protein 137 [Caenorhabditis elegans]|nr:Coiled-coil domain-containing protein 137 [Caenorhabditis elegans]CDH92944.1 Coiled-coil domain-containing protein 137 [Caenorhabditis elegans]|eukprot:NP_001293537.1 Uncharacterized protein CELE_Y54E2A.8 [Caenorhabditis elegans]